MFEDLNLDQVRKLIRNEDDEKVDEVCAKLDGAKCSWCWGDKPSSKKRMTTNEKLFVCDECWSLIETAMKPFQVPKRK